MLIDTSSFTFDGKYKFKEMVDKQSQPRGIAFSPNGLKMYVGSDPTGGYMGAMKFTNII